MPWTATVSPERAPLLRSELYVVMPAQSSGATSTDSSFSGRCTPASCGTTVYSAYPPS